MKKWSFLIGLSLLLSSILTAAAISRGIAAVESLQDTITYEKKTGLVKKGSLVPLPLVFYTPETNLALGGVLFNIFRLNPDDTLSNPSFVRTALIFTLRSQLLTNVKHDIFTNEEKYRITGNLTFAKFPDYFYGIGNHTSESDEELFTANIFNLKTQVMREIFPDLYAGLLYNLNVMGNVDEVQGGLLDSNEITGDEGSISSGLGIILQWDTRDFTLNASKGHFIEFATRHFRDYLGSEFIYNIVELDSRKFLTFFPGHVLGLQFIGRFSNRDVPFHQLSLLGGDEIMRGYYRGRYRDKMLYAFQAEYRWSFYRRFGLVVFGGLADVGPEFNAFDFSEVKPSYGAGLRYMILPERKVNLRLDFGFGNNTNGIYINITEAF